MPALSCLLMQEKQRAHRNLIANIPLYSLPSCLHSDRSCGDVLFVELQEPSAHFGQHVLLQGRLEKMWEIHLTPRQEEASQADKVAEFLHLIGRILIKILNSLPFPFH